MDDKVSKGRQGKGSVISKKLTEEKVFTILGMLQNGKKHREVRAVFNIASGTLGAIASGTTWKHVRKQFLANGVQLETIQSGGEKPALALN